MPFSLRTAPNTTTLLPRIRSLSLTGARSVLCCHSRPPPPMCPAGPRFPPVGPATLCQCRDPHAVSVPGTA
eukprot:761891-Rhodomonas_salina.1